ncbi:MAG TPA: hypothetical protein VFQ35_25545 [Polyangiaceae bacterium]|nr:hypothetical protein [Polyangiaceae bacterium]
MRARFSARTTIASLWLFSAARSWADEPPAALVVVDWRAPASCPAREAILDEANRLLGDAPRASASSLVARGRIVRETKSYVLELELDQDRRTTRRRLVAHACPELGRAAALVLALAVDPSLVSRNEAAEPGALLECPPTPEPVCPNPEPVASSERSCAPKPEPTCPALHAPAPRPEPPGDAPRNFHVGGGVRIATGELPETLPSPELYAGYGTAPFRVDLAARFASAHSTVSAGAASFQSWTLRPRLCFGRPLRELVASVCADVSLGRVRGEGAGADVVHTRWSNWVAPGLEVLLELPVGSSAVGLSLAGELPLVRTKFELAGARVFEPAKLVASAGLVGTIGLF